MLVIYKRGLLILLPPLSEAILEALPFQQTSSRNTIQRTPLQERSHWFLQTSWISEKPRIFVIESMCLLFAHSNALDRPDRPASSAKVYCCALRRQVPPGLGGRRTPRCEQRRGSAALCWEMRAEPGLQDVLGCICQHTLTATCTSTDTWLRSPLQHHCQKHTHIKVCWYRSSLGANQQPQPPLFPLHPSSLPHAGAGFLHSLALTPALLPAYFFFFLETPLDQGQNN